MNAKIPSIVDEFSIFGDFLDAIPYGSGHINDTFLVTVSQAGQPVRYILQRINHTIFPDVPALMSNILRVTQRQRTSIRADDRTRRALTLVPTKEGAPFLTTSTGEFWRVYLFIEKASTHDVVGSRDQAFQAAAAFGAFQSMVKDLPEPRLHETVPGFHDTPTRLRHLETVIEKDPKNRAVQVVGEIDFILKRRSLTEVLEQARRNGEVPERVTHNDTKINNVMLDDSTGEGVCVIDLDTVMPGLSAYDFGDLVRTSTSPSPEDERDLSRIDFRMEIYDALVRGFLSTAGGVMTPPERHHLFTGGIVITLETGIRFLTDYIAGDVYFRTHRPGQNIDRCRTQLRLVELMEEREEEARRIVEEFAV